MNFLYNYNYNYFIYFLSSTILFLQQTYTISQVNHEGLLQQQDPGSPDVVSLREGLFEPWLAISFVSLRPIHLPCNIPLVTCIFLIYTLAYRLVCLPRKYK